MGRSRGQNRKEIKEDEYLLWDKPLSEQSEKVRKILEKYYEDSSKDIYKFTGEDFYRDFAGGSIVGRNAKFASDELNSLGIRG